MVKTLTAMANTDCTKNVYIIIGIADNENAVKDSKTIIMYTALLLIVVMLELMPK